MKKQSNGATSAPQVTIAIPPIALPNVTAHLPPPALISADVGAEHVGLTRAGLVDVLAAMRRDPDFAGCVILMSRKRSAAAPADVVRFLRARFTALAATPVTSEAATAGDCDTDRASGVDRVLALVGGERTPDRGKRLAKGGR
jgi:hypothetical protein